MPVLTSGRGHGAKVRAEKRAFRRGMLQDEYNYKNRNNLDLSESRGERELELQKLQDMGAFDRTSMQHGPGGSYDRGLKANALEGASNRAMTFANNERQRGFYSDEWGKNRQLEAGLNEMDLRRNAFDDAGKFVDDEGMMEFNGKRLAATPERLQAKAEQMYDFYRKKPEQAQPASNKYVQMQGAEVTSQNEAPSWAKGFHPSLVAQINKSAQPEGDGVTAKLNRLKTGQQPKQPNTLLKSPGMNAINRVTDAIPGVNLYKNTAMKMIPLYETAGKFWGKQAKQAASKGWDKLSAPY